MRIFSSFTFEEVEEMFEVVEDNSLSLLSEWMSATATIDEMQRYMLNRIKKRLFDNVLVWNEDELKMFCIGTIIDMVEIESKAFKPFTQRSFYIKWQDIEIGGRVDFMIAGGRKTPKLPYFCIHEYKQEGEKESDPLGQLLIAMVAAYESNPSKIPILGAYIVGRNWFFVVLEGKKYARSNEYNATDDDIFQIFAILQKSKEIITRFI